MLLKKVRLIFLPLEYVASSLLVIPLLHQFPLHVGKKNHVKRFLNLNEIKSK